jgi:hypothetical protein
VTIFSYFLRALRKKKTHGYFIQVGATAHIANYSICVLKEMFEDRMKVFRLWPADLNLSDFFLWGNIKNKVYSNNLHTADKLKTTSVKELHPSRSVNSN